VVVYQLVAKEVDAIEILVSPDNIRRVRETPHLATYPYKGAAYAYLGFNLAANGDSTKPHPLFGDRTLRRALTMATDRERLVNSVFGDNAKVPPGPMSQQWWIWDPEIRELPYDTALAGRLLASRGWIDTDGDGVRERAGATLSFRLLVPTTSAVRRAYARLLQEQFRRIGVEVQIDEVEFSVFQQREQAGQFDAMIQTWNTDPTPSSGMNQTWTQGGIGHSNYLRYASAPFDHLVEQASTTFDRNEARRNWRAAMELINQDAPAVFLFAVQNVAAIHRRVAGVAIRPDSWWALVRTWRIPPGRLIHRDRVER
jgi:peptide/nickel transport system substrate-binding protein